MPPHLDTHSGPAVIAVDRNYVPMMEIARRKAVRAVATGRAFVLDPATLERHGDFRSAMSLIIYPQARALAETKLLMGRLERRVLKRDHHTCQYDGCSNRATTVDHVIPVCQGGRTSWQNLVAACLVCNQTKGGRTPEQAGMRLKRIPRGPRAHLFERFEAILKEASAA
ncbi:MAG TPA: HNH endonuclease [Holophaga sp.]|nr:HNH endonuclease [Holophaga sp.]HPS67260.1 HNH endonuclease [Holophaga sp.]